MEGNPNKLVVFSRLRAAFFLPVSYSFICYYYRQQLPMDMSTSMRTPTWLSSMFDAKVLVFEPVFGLSIEEVKDRAEMYYEEWLINEVLEKI